MLPDLSDGRRCYLETAAACRLHLLRLPIRQGLLLLSREYCGDRDRVSAAKHDF